MNALPKETNELQTPSKTMVSPITLVARLIQKSYAGHVSRVVLLTTLLPLSFILLFGTLIAAALFFPSGYDWRVCVVSTLTSPLDNPKGCWLPSLGIMAAMLLASPFAGYIAQHLRAITPRLGRMAGQAFALSFALMILAMAVQLAQPVIGPRRLHEFAARTSAGFFILGMFCCCGCALKDQLRSLGGQKTLPVALAFYWASLTLLPIVCLAGVGTLMLLGHQAGQTWAEDLRQSFRHTPLWQLAFWEWLGALVAFAFLTGSVLLSPASWVSTPAEARMSSLLGELGKVAWIFRRKHPDNNAADDQPQLSS